MSLEDLLAPVKWMDEQVLREYTKVVKKFHLDEGRKKYVAGISLWLTSVILCAPTEKYLIGDFEPISPRFLLDTPDFIYNHRGIVGNIKDEITSETKASDPFVYFYKRFNSVVRFPLFAAGVGFVSIFGVELFNYITNEEPIHPNSYNCLKYGLGLMSLSSSMYIKDTDPKLLDKAPFWKKAVDYIKERITPAPQPVPVENYTTLEKTINIP